MNNQRSSNFELLRIVAMLFIIAAHLAGHSKIVIPKGEITLNIAVISLCKFGGNIGIALFGMISGYWLTKPDGSVRLFKLIKFWLQVVFYSV